jgi:hypothetical protein
MYVADEELEALFDTGDSQPQPYRITTATKYLMHYAWPLKKPHRLHPAVVFAILFTNLAVWFAWPLLRNVSINEHSPPPTVPINLRPWFNNQAVTWGGAAIGGGFDGDGSSYRAEDMLSSSVVSSGVKVKPFGLPDTACDLRKK